MKRLKLVLSLYACEPHRGSEPGVGWAWALGMAKRHDTYVLTRANNREVIEEALAKLQLPETETPKFIYVDLSPMMLKLKKKGMPITLYYLLWQFKACKALNSLNLNADIIHHITFCSFACPGVWWRRKEKVVLGPVGGMCICPPAFFRLFKGSKLVKEVVRTFVLKLWRFNVFYHLSKKYADAMLFVDKPTQDIVGQGAKLATLMIDTAVPIELESSQYDALPEKQNQFVFAGILEPRKGFEIAVRAYGQAFSGVEEKPILKVFGSGPEIDRYKELVSELGLCDSIVFQGRVPQTLLWDEISRSKALVFPSVRDTCGCVTQEALAVQTPVICFNHQGVSEVTDEACAFRVEPSDWDTAISGFATAMKELHDNPKRVERMGQAGRKRVLQFFTWDMKFDGASKIYERVLK